MTFKILIFKTFLNQYDAGKLFKGNKNFKRVTFIEYCYPSSEKNKTTIIE